MAGTWKFNPPPGWPRPPSGWVPPPGWRPRRTWPQAPDGWKFWVEEPRKPRNKVAIILTVVGVSLALVAFSFAVVRQRAANEQDAATFAFGLEHTCVVNRSGGVSCWGWNFYGQLGDGTTKDRTTPVQVLTPLPPTRRLSTELKALIGHELMHVQCTLPFLRDLRTLFPLVRGGFLTVGAEGLEPPTPSL